MKSKMKNLCMLILLCLTISFIIVSCNFSLDPGFFDDCDIDLLIKQNIISDDCREAINEFLSKAENNLDNNIIRIGEGKIDCNPVLFLIVTDELAVPVDLSLSNINVEGYQYGTFNSLNPEDYQLARPGDFSGTHISLSSIIDYSGSMRDQDIDDAVKIYKDIFFALNPYFESEIRIFSQSVLKKSGFISDINTLQNRIARDRDFPRGSTALLDAIGAGLTALSLRDNLVRLLIVSTDGLENSSVVYTKESQIYNLAKQHNIPVIIFGSMFADIKFMQKMAQETNGIFIYNRTFFKLKEDASLLVQMFSEIWVVKITGASWLEATSFRVTVNNKTITFNLSN